MRNSLHADLPLKGDIKINGDGESPPGFPVFVLNCVAKLVEYAFMLQCVTFNDHSWTSHPSSAFLPPQVKTTIAMAMKKKKLEQGQL